MKAESPSARKVWIEIEIDAILKNLYEESPSARKVWIEIVQEMML